MIRDKHTHTDKDTQREREKERCTRLIRDKHTHTHIHTHTERERKKERCTLRLLLINFHAAHPSSCFYFYNIFHQRLVPGKNTTKKRNVRDAL